MSPDREAIVTRIRASGQAVRRAVERLAPGQERRPPRPGEWSVQETLIHLRNVVVMVHGLRIRRLFYETDPVFGDYDEAAGREAALRADESVRDLVEMIAREHEQLAALLQTLPDDRWGRQGRHPELGAMSIELLARRVAEHAEEHAAQAAAAAGVRP
jgi:hypothetical protein